MAGKKTAKKDLFRLMVTFLVIPLLLLNTYAFLQLKNCAEFWSFSIIPGSLSETLTQLALIILANSAVLVFFVIYIQTSKNK